MVREQKLSEGMRWEYECLAKLCVANSVLAVKVKPGVSRNIIRRCTFRDSNGRASGVFPLRES